MGYNKIANQGSISILPRNAAILGGYRFCYRQGWRRYDKYNLYNASIEMLPEPETRFGSNDNACLVTPPSLAVTDFVTGRGGGLTTSTICIMARIEMLPEPETRFLKETGFLTYPKR